MLGKILEASATKVGRGIGHVKVAKQAYKEAPGQHLGSYVKQHRVGVGLTAATFLPIGHVSGRAAANRRSSHTGIDQKGGDVNGSM